MRINAVGSLIFLIWFLCPNKSLSQSLGNQGEIWLAYISSFKLTERFSLWNDFHYVSTSFFASRHGITYSIKANHSLTVGYAWVTTSTNFSSKLIRPENRPWTQLAGRFPISDKSLYQYRLRYDARFRKSVSNTEILNDRIFYHRLRLMNGFRFYLKDLPNKNKFHIDVLDELLINFGKQVDNGIDQNRLYLLLGFSSKTITVLSGYDWRVIPMQNQNFIFRHGLTIWLIHNLNLQKK